MNATGRQFYKCGRRDGGCDFFLWADQADADGVGGGGGNQWNATAYNSMYSPPQSQWQGQKRQEFSSGSQRSKGRVQSGGDSVVCGCGLQAIQRTVQKEGPNKGRQFYTCSKPREEQCGFFEWADDVPASHVCSNSVDSRRGRRGGGGGRGGAGDWSQPSIQKKRAPPTCSVCREVGHTKRSCPQARGN